jgi:hypothetical protein
MKKVNPDIVATFCKNDKFCKNEMAAFVAVAPFTVMLKKPAVELMKVAEGIRPTVTRKYPVSLILIVLLLNVTVVIVEGARVSHTTPDPSVTVCPQDVVARTIAKS